YMLVFVPEFGVRGIWISIFTAVSAFCNAGIDIISDNSLCNYATHPLINFVTIALIVLGGIGYIVWWDVLRVLKSRTARSRKIFRHLTLHTKIAVTVTAGLIVIGTVLIFIFEYTNPSTMGNLSLFDKLQVSLFQSVTTRTAGFASVPQENLTNASAWVSLLLMIIGGSPVGTAGGMKTVTVAVLVFVAIATVKNKNNATAFGRCLSPYAIRKAVAVSVIFISICFTSTLLLMAASDAPVLDVIYESFSATATVGLSRNFTASLNGLGKLIIIATMYLGRVGPISLALALGNQNASQNVISEPTEEISIG
ncbi:MAG: potassium transporter KtrB, partial [Clostridia bacterium]|nr:potassium transporter KtrB [Clostridia bacterium]